MVGIATASKKLTSFGKKALDTLETGNRHIPAIKQSAVKFIAKTVFVPKWNTLKYNHVIKCCRNAK